MPDGVAPKGLRVAISGLGWIAINRHLPCFRKAGAEVVAAYHPANPRETFGLPIAEKFEDLFEFKPDIIAVCSPPSAHAEQAIKAIEHGCHVLVEKPMAISLKEARSMAEAAQRHKRTLCVAHSHLFDRAMIKALNQVNSGEIGELTSVQALFYRGHLRPGKPWLFELPGGLAFDELPHPVYLMERFLGRVQVASLNIEAVPSRETPRQVHVTLKGERGTGHIAMIMDSPVSEWHLVISGTRKMLDVDLFRDVLVALPSDGAHTPSKVLKTSWAGLSGHTFGVLSSGIKYVLGRLYYGHDILIERLLASIQSGSPPPVSLEEALRTQELVEKILSPLKREN